MQNNPTTIIAGHTTEKATTVKQQQTTDLTTHLFDCSDLPRDAPSGVYTLLSDVASHPLGVKDAYCDMETDGGG